MTEASPPRSLTFTCRTAEETAALGEALARALDGAPPTVVLLAGELGAGKTTLAKGFARALGVSARSPSFTVINEHRLPGGGTLYHADLFRVRGASAVERTGLSDLVAQGDGHVLVEWPEALEADENTVVVEMRVAGTARTLTVVGPKAVLERLKAESAPRDNRAS